MRDGQYLPGHPAYDVIKDELDAINAARGAGKLPITDERLAPPDVAAAALAAEEEPEDAPLRSCERPWRRVWRTWREIARDHPVSNALPMAYQRGVLPTQLVTQCPLGRVHRRDKLDRTCLYLAGAVSVFI